MLTQTRIMSPNHNQDNPSLPDSSPFPRKTDGINSDFHLLHGDTDTLLLPTITLYRVPLHNIHDNLELNQSGNNGKRLNSRRKQIFLRFTLQAN